MKTTTAFFLCCSLLLFNCKKENTHSLISATTINDTLVKKSKIDIKNWHFKDIVLDTIPGISLQRAYDSLLQNKKGQEVIVAIIDTEIDTNHGDLKGQFWVNPNEIANNGIDDDKNGYVDDLHGWNFLGNKKGENNIFVNFEFTRILKKNNFITSQASGPLFIYEKAKKSYNKRLEYDLKEKENANLLYNSYFNAKTTLSKYFVNKKFNIKSLDSLRKLKKGLIKDDHFIILIDCLKYDIGEDYIVNEQFQVTQRLTKLLNLKYNDRFIQGDNPNDLSDINYGNNIVNGNLDYFNHGTKMTGILVVICERINLKVMPIAISSFGDEHDKDISLAIKYAVDNGAKIINMSFSKGFSLHSKWVLNAIKYAEEKNVLIITSAGNNSQNLDTKDVFNFPNDHGYFNEKEVSDNLLKIGSTEYSENLKELYSNYGKKEVDIFAPGSNIYTTLPFNKYTSSAGGTSSASAITSGVAALIFSYYPNLTASQVKHIIMDSGIEYTVEVKTPTKEDKKKTTPFNQLSKSGKVVNAYNALIMAERISKQ